MQYKLVTHIRIIGYYNIYLNRSGSRHLMVQRKRRFIILNHHLKK